MRHRLSRLSAALGWLPLVLALVACSETQPELTTPGRGVSVAASDEDVAGCTELGVISTGPTTLVGSMEEQRLTKARNRAADLGGDTVLPGAMNLQDPDLEQGLLNRSYRVYRCAAGGPEPVAAADEPLPPPVEEGGRVRVSGSACYRFSDRESLEEARRVALALARRDAVERYAVHVNAQATVENYRLTEDEVGTVAEGLLYNVRVVGEREDFSRREVCRTIEAELDPARIRGGAQEGPE